jgi:hypothetical protein
MMQPVAITLSEFFQQMGEAFRRYLKIDPAVAVTLLGVLILLVMVAIIAHRLSPLIHRDREIKLLFRRLCEANRLDGGETELLISLSRKLGMDNPCIFFVRRSLLETQQKAELERIPPGRRDIVRTTFLSLMSKLFEEHA